MLDEKRLENIYKDHVLNEKNLEMIKLNREHIRKLEDEIEILMKQKAVLQDKIDTLEAVNE